MVINFYEINNRNGIGVYRINFNITHLQNQNKLIDLGN